MTTTFALAGKGGVGKTTLAALIIKYLVEVKEGSILAIDADPSSNLNLLLGLDLDWTVGDIREDMLEQVKQSLVTGGAAMGAMPGGLTKRDYLDYHIRASMAESHRYDLIAMGRSEGTGCYCAVNHNLRDVLDTIGKTYRYIVIDNEAGMEHLSRRTTRDVDYLMIVSDATPRGLMTARRIATFRNELDIHIANAYLVLNRVDGDIPETILDQIKSIEIPLLGILPPDHELPDREIEGLSLVDIPSTNPVYRAASSLMEKIKFA
jgi:CO dehydrogenase maturation factor